MASMVNSKNVLSRLSLSLALLFLSANSHAEEFLRSGEPDLGAAASQQQTIPHFESLAQILSPSVVNISVETAEAAQEGEEPLPPGLPFFKKPDSPGQSLGSGFFLSTDGYIATNFHVVEKAEKIIVRLLDDRNQYDAKLVGKDEKTDLALLKIDLKSAVTPVFIGDSDEIRVGEWVMAIGNQFQLGQTVTAGIVSAKSRKVRSKSGGPYDDFIQTDASINPGSSGGPLFNSRGQVIGINTAIFSPGRGPFGGTGFNIGIGFAIPINMASGILKQLKEQGKVTRGLLGVIIQSIDENMAEALGLKEIGGALVAEVVPDSPADKAGFKVADIILEFDGKPIVEHDDLPLLVANTTLGSTVAVSILRGGEQRTLRPKIIELKDDVFAPLETLDAQVQPNRIGIVVEELNELLARSLKLPIKDGVIIASVDANSPAQKAGLVVGDIIVELNSKSIKSEKDLDAVVKELPEKKAILVLVRTRVKGQNASRFLTLKIE